ncbi:MAG: DUF1963 domain-containing protein [Leptolyngbyaceae cyanobacterium CAN_BIN12]|nr:DUF1963 domain-containing protein [Leptolyngbyaceae cyanobacterium CAN_BIN12]
MNGTEIIIRYGRIGTTGQSSSTTYATAETAQSEAAKKINEKLKKGYLRISSKEDLPTPSDQPTDGLAPVLTASEVSSRTINLAILELRVYEGRIVLGVPLQRSLVAIEITAICSVPTFTINLDVAKDIAYHMDVRAYQGQIVQNTCVAGGWGGEERLTIPADLTSGQPFTLKIAVEQTLVVYLNDQVTSRYAHRLPPTQIDAVHIVYTPGNLQVQSVQVFEHEDMEPFVAALSVAMNSQRSQPEQPPNDSQATVLLQGSPITSETTATPQFLGDLPSQFEPFRPFLEANLVPYIKVQATEVQNQRIANVGSSWCHDPLELWQSKIGGHPYLPPQRNILSVRCQTGQLMMFLMQINCADLPVISSLNLPKQAILQFYIGLVEMCELSPEQHRVLYFPEVSQNRNDLITDFSFLEESAIALDWEWYENVYTLNFSSQQDVFWDARRQMDDAFEIPEALKALYEDFNEWISDYEDRCSLHAQSQGGRRNKLGGHPELHSIVGETIEGARGHLLLELQHEFNSDDNFYFFIEETDLASRNFNSIESYFLRN